MNEYILFRGKRKYKFEWLEDFEWVEGYYYPGFQDTSIAYILSKNDGIVYEVHPESVGQYTGLNDKNGNKIFVGDILRIRTPYRESQTHYGDNIPLGQYTEPMEPAIKEVELPVLFSNGKFTTDEKDDYWSISFYIIKYDLETAKEGFNGWYFSSDIWYGEDGDLQYLLETYGLSSEDDLINYLGVEVIGNLYDSKL